MSRTGSNISDTSRPADTKEPPMQRKIVLVIAAATLSVPVGAALAGGPAFASSSTHSVSVDRQHKESRTPRATTRPRTPRATTRSRTPRATTRPRTPRATTRPRTPRATTRPRNRARVQHLERRFARRVLTTVRADLEKRESSPVRGGAVVLRCTASSVCLADTHDVEWPFRGPRGCSALRSARQGHRPSGASSICASRPRALE